MNCAISTKDIIKAFIEDNSIKDIIVVKPYDIRLRMDNGKKILSDAKFSCKKRIFGFY